MADYTLYIDESGDFKDEQKNWVVGGILMLSNFKNCEKEIKKEFNKKIETLKLDYVENIRDLHLTEIRKNSYEEADRVWHEFVEQQDNYGGIKYYCLATVNRQKYQSKKAEYTYRLMLLDLLLQIEEFFSDIPQDSLKLDLVVATRTIDGERQTTVNHIKEEILQSLTRALESDLAAKGYIATLGHKINLKLESANDTCGLILADFVCNTVFNERHKTESINRLKDTNRLYLYETFSSHKLRRIQTHIHLQNYIIAIFSLMEIMESDKNYNNYKEDIDSFLDTSIITAFINSGTKGNEVNFQSLLERIWRSDHGFIDSYDKKLIQLEKLLEHLERINNKITIDKLELFKFQINNMCLLCCNHRADVEKAEEIIKKQEEALLHLQFNPEYLSIFMDFSIRRIESKVNQLNFSEAQELSEKYDKSVKNYKDIWELLSDSQDLIDKQFCQSSFYKKSKSNLIRCAILALPLNHQTTEDIDKIQQNIEEIKTLDMNSSDKSRVSGYEILLNIKQGKFDNAYQLAYDFIENEEKITIFDVVYLLYGINQKVLALKDYRIVESEYQKVNGLLEQKKVKNIIEKYQSKYPKSIYYREYSLFLFLFNRKTKSEEMFKKANLSELVKEQHIYNFFKLINDIQKGLIGGQEIDIEQVNNKVEEFSIGVHGQFQDKYELMFQLRQFFLS